MFGVMMFVSQTVSAQFNASKRAVTPPQCNRDQLSPIRCGYFQEGYLDGANDARSNRDNDYKRYKNKYENQYESFYRTGYDEGYGSVKPYSRWTNKQKDAYDRGYNFGDDDRDRGISRLPARYEGRYDRSYELYYRRGYVNGYDRKPKQYDVPLGTTRNPGRRLPFPNRRTNRKRGTTTGTLTWNGRVDNRVQIVLRGDDVQTKTVAGRNPSGVFHNLRGVLPRSNGTLSVRKLDGRGTARVVQQPNRSNNYTGIVEVADPKRKTDNYNLQITWQSSNVQEAYSSGKLTWRGRVDQTVNIRISGDFVESIKVQGNPLTGVDYDLQGYLAGRNGSVRVRKRDGRGTVTILEQPSRQNDYTAVIQIFDPKGGDDKYEIEVDW